MLYCSNCKYTLSLFRASYRQAVKGSFLIIMATLGHVIQVVQNSRQVLTQQGEEKKRSRLLVLQVNMPWFIQEPHAIRTTSSLAFYTRTTALISGQVVFHSISQMHNEWISYSPLTIFNMSKKFLSVTCIGIVLYSKVLSEYPEIPLQLLLWVLHTKILYHSVLNTGG